MANSGGPTSPSWVDAVIGAALIALGVLMVWPRHHTDADRAHAHKIRMIGPPTPAVAYAALGAALMILNGSSILVLIAIMRNVAQAGQPATYDAVAMAIVWVITTLPAWGPLVLVLTGGAAMAARVMRLGH